MPISFLYSVMNWKRVRARIMDDARHRHDDTTAHPQHIWFVTYSLQHTHCPAAVSGSDQHRNSLKAKMYARNRVTNMESSRRIVSTSLDAICAQHVLISIIFQPSCILLFVLINSDWNVNHYSTLHSSAWHFSRPQKYIRKENKNNNKKESKWSVSFVTTHEIETTIASFFPLDD